MAFDELILGSTLLIADLQPQDEVLNNGVDLKSLVKRLSTSNTSILHSSRFAVSRSVLLTLLDNSRSFSPQNSNGYFAKFEKNSRLKKAKVIGKITAGQTNRLQLVVEYLNDTELSADIKDIQRKLLLMFLAEKSILEFLAQKKKLETDYDEMESSIRTNLGTVEFDLETEDASQKLDVLLSKGLSPNRFFIFGMGYFKKDEDYAFKILNLDNFSKIRRLNQHLIAKCLQFEENDEYGYFKCLFEKYAVAFEDPTRGQPGEPVSTKSSTNPISVIMKPTFKIFFGPPGTGKTRKAKEQIADLDVGNYRIVQVHPSSSYEDIVEGIKPVTFSDGELKYEVVDGPIKIMANKASGNAFSTLAKLTKLEGGLVQVELPSGTSFRYGLNKCKIGFEPNVTRLSIGIPKSDIFELPINNLPKEFQDNFTAPGRYQKIHISGEDWGKKENYLIILDEFNRGNVASILGEMIFVISEVDSDVGERKPVSLQYSHELFSWPANLSLFGTMNSTDLSIDRVDQAIKRRFEFEEVTPDYNIFDKQNLSEAHKVFSFLAASMSINKYFDENKIGKSPKEIMKVINSALSDHAAEKNAFNVDDKLIGHSYFIKLTRKIVETYESTIPIGEKKSEIIGNLVKQLLEKDIKPAMLNIFNGDRKNLEDFIITYLPDWEQNFGYKWNSNWRDFRPTSKAA